MKHYVALAKSPGKAEALRLVEVDSTDEVGAIDVALSARTEWREPVFVVAYGGNFVFHLFGVDEHVRSRLAAVGINAQSTGFGYRLRGQPLRPRWAGTWRADNIEAVEQMLNELIASGEIKFDVDQLPSRCMQSGVYA